MHPPSKDIPFACIPALAGFILIENHPPLLPGPQSPVPKYGFEWPLSSTAVSPLLVWCCLEYGSKEPGLCGRRTCASQRSALGGLLLPADFPAGFQLCTFEMAAEFVLPLLLTPSPFVFCSPE